jgi:hypothetical protein
MRIHQVHSEEPRLVFGREFAALAAQPTAGQKGKRGRWF